MKVIVEKCLVMCMFPIKNPHCVSSEFRGIKATYATHPQIDTIDFVVTQCFGVWR
ncbi:hypothetical protein JCM19235_5013 [Vibrio maritimus]|uniref:Uncharacterized protein n=1 Tax=Vibrio maritimus TaxID=990268 RepID=A0A090S1X3_9VIBR|nr:hypothetical protein JCM19235_5013 [Vibrio maritimus]